MAVFYFQQMLELEPTLTKNHCITTTVLYHCATAVAYVAVVAVAEKKNIVHHNETVLFDIVPKSTRQLSACRVRGRPRFGSMDGVKVALGNRGVTVEVARQCAKDRKEWRAKVHM